jgi:hypothetical protein
LLGVWEKVEGPGNTVRFRLKGVWNKVEGPRNRVGFRLWGVWNDKFEGPRNRAGLITRLAMFPTMYANIAAPPIISITAKIISGTLTGVMSPYPTVVIVVKAQYMLTRYL